MTPTLPCDLLDDEPMRAEDALQAQDLEALRYWLERGWRFRQVSTSYGNTKDLSPVLRLIASGWAEGWELMVTHMPELLDSQPLWDATLQYARTDILKSFLAHGTDPNRRTHSGLLPVLALANSLNQSWNLPWAIQTPRPVMEYPTTEAFELALIASYDVLVAAGSTLGGVHPGAFEPDDLSPSGHTIWTRAIAHRKWLLAAHVFPDSWAAMVAQPRGLEAIEFLRRCAREHLLHDPTDWSGKAAGLWQRFLGLALGPWLDTVRDAFDLPEDWGWLPQMDAAQRAILWNHWGKARDDGWTGLHQLALHGGSPEAAAVLRHMAHDQAASLEQWNQAQSEGVTPAQLWAMAVAERTGQPMDQVDSDWQLIALQLDQAAARAPSALPVTE